MQSVTDIGTLIVHTPEICDGRPRIADTRVCSADCSLVQDGAKCRMKMCHPTYKSS
ncbi:DUF433 domain-containing protein [Trichocoleus sp. ST-U2]|uniref:DUF433 domain-containing protein n=1 Tax=Coleofasciculus sp. FACHB-SPT9 TaxID=2692791 RepID=UPI0018EF7416|nr:DUF433 domain-containing protein [Coleofasciculus sp. FACHB-SPT9]